MLCVLPEPPPREYRFWPARRARCVLRQPKSVLRQFRIVAKLPFQHVAGIDDRAFAGQPFHLAKEGFQIIERNALIFVIGGVEIEILSCFADKILRLIFHVAGPQEVICAPEQAGSERILFALRFGCLVDDADHAINFWVFKTIDFVPVLKIDHRLVKHDCLFQR